MVFQCLDFPEAVKRCLFVSGLGGVTCRVLLGQVVGLTQASLCSLTGPMSAAGHVDIMVLG